MGFLSGITSTIKKIVSPITKVFSGGGGIGGILGGLTSLIPGVGPFLGPIVGGIGGLLGDNAGSIAGYMGSEKANEANSALALQQMAFQENARKTQYQTAMADMKQAGLNPILAYKQGGAGNLNGASAVMQNSGAAAAQALSQTTNSAYAKAQTNLMMKQLDSQVKKIAAEADRAQWEALIVRKDWKQKEMQTKIQEHFLPSILHKAKVAEKSSDLQWLERILDPIGKIFGNSNSALDLFQTRK